MSRRTEIAYKAQSPGKLAQHNKAPGSGDRVNAAVVQRQFTSLSGEICLTLRLSTMSPTIRCDDRLGQPVDQVPAAAGKQSAFGRAKKQREPIRMDLAGVGSVALYRVTGKVIRQKSAEAIVAQRLG